jgi:hypothetical protein
MRLTSLSLDSLFISDDFGWSNCNGLLNVARGSMKQICMLRVLDKMRGIGFKSIRRVVNTD